MVFISAPLSSISLLYTVLRAEAATCYLWSNTLLSRKVEYWLTLVGFEVVQKSIRRVTTAEQGNEECYEIDFLQEKKHLKGNTTVHCWLDG